MLKLVRTQEHQKRTKLREDAKGSGSSSGNVSEGIGYAVWVDVIWNRQSAISASKCVEELLLTRWDPATELSLWNCVQLTKAEATTHDRVGKTIRAMAKAAAKLTAAQAGSMAVAG
ncbi:hypothetical protein BJ742DRAFT_859503 [Cladochytrium replicatum]|nr:hypothetical protein BJ742DRAFT_859503 [Cladochytrium replicatum]